jgi:hypothetical protein
VRSIPCVSGGEDGTRKTERNGAALLVFLWLQEGEGRLSVPGPSEWAVFFFWVFLLFVEEKTDLAESAVLYDIQAVHS